MTVRHASEYLLPGAQPPSGRVRETLSRARRLELPVMDAPVGSSVLVTGGHGETKRAVAMDLVDRWVKEEGQRVVDLDFQFYVRVGDARTAMAYEALLGADVLLVSGFGADDRRACLDMFDLLRARRAASVGSIVMFTEEDFVSLRRAFLSEMAELAEASVAQSLRVRRPSSHALVGRSLGPSQSL